MMNTRALTIGAVAFVLLGARLDAQEFSRYRTFQLGGNLASVLTSTGASASEVKTLHEAPALLRNLEWRPSRWTAGTATATNDPVERMVFSFYEDQLFRIAVDYGHDATEGMKDTDLVEAISAVYGAPLPKSPRSAARVASDVDSDSGGVVAHWGDAEHAIVLYRTSTYGTAWRLTVTALPLDALARKAETRAAQLDAQEAPRREVARQKQERTDMLATAEKTRVANKKIFKP